MSDDINELKKILAPLQNIEPQPSVLNSWTKQVLNEAKGKRHGLRRWYPVPAMAALVAAAFLLGLWIGGRAFQEAATDPLAISDARHNIGKLEYVYVQGP